MGEIKIIKATVKEAKSYHKAVDTIAKERKYLSMTVGFPLDGVKTFVANAVEQNFAQYFAMDGKKVVGWCDVIPKTNEGMTHVGICGIGLLKEYRGQGLGSKLMDAAIEHAVQKNNITRLELTVYTSNKRARALYEKKGFVVEGVQKNARYLDGEYDDIVMMAKLV